MPSTEKSQMTGSKIKGEIGILWKGKDRSADEKRALGVGHFFLTPKNNLSIVQAPNETAH